MKRRGAENAEEVLRKELCVLWCAKLSLSDLQHVCSDISLRDEVTQLEMKFAVAPEMKRGNWWIDVEWSRSRVAVPAKLPVLGELYFRPRSVKDNF